MGLNEFQLFKSWDSKTKLYTHISTVNVLKFRTLYSVLFWPKLCFLCTCFLKYLVEWHSVDPDQTAPSGAVWSGSALFAFVILSETLVFEFLEHLPYPHYVFVNKFIFSYFSMKTYVVGTHYKRLSEALLTNTHKKCFHGETRKIFTGYPLLSRDMVPTICSRVTIKKKKKNSPKYQLKYYFIWTCRYVNKFTPYYTRKT